MQLNKDECMLYAGSKTHDGYGLVWYQERTRTVNLYVHRVMYENFVGPITEGLEVDHLCFTPECINPDHLEPVTGTVNNERKYGKGLCKRGHKLTPDNVYITVQDKVTGRTSKSCKICNQMRSRAVYLKKKGNK